LAALLERPDFLGWLQEVAAAGPADPRADGRRGAANAHALANSCLDAFHLAHFRERAAASPHLLVTPARRMVEALRARVAGHGLTDVGDGLCVLEMREMSQVDGPDGPAAAEKSGCAALLASIPFVGRYLGRYPTAL
jgi:hypothetical protein